MTIRLLILFGWLAWTLTAGVALGAMDEGFTGQVEPEPLELPEPPPDSAKDTTAFGTLEAMPRDYELTIAFNTMYYDYREQVPAPLKSTETGTLGGFTLGLSHWVKDTGQKFHVDGSFIGGRTTYDGTTQTGTPVLDTTNDTFWEVHVQYGFALWTFSENDRLRLVTGLNYRYWRRYGQYREDYSWWEIPFGIGFESDVSESFSWEVQDVLNWQQGGRIKVFFSGYDPTLADADGIIEDSLGMRLEARFTLFRQAVFPLMVVPWVEYIHFNQGPEFPIKSTAGTSQGTAFEPASRAWRFGIMFGTAFRF